MKNNILKTSLISLGIITVASAPIIALTQSSQAHEEAIYMEVESYKEGYRDGFRDAMLAVLEEMDIYGDWEDDNWDDWDDEDVTYLDEAPQGLQPSYLPAGMAFEEAFSYTDEDGYTEDVVSYYNPEADAYLELSRYGMSEAEAMELFAEDMDEVSSLPSKDIAGTTVYFEQDEDYGEPYTIAYFSKADGLYTVDTNLSEAELNVVLSSILGS